MAQDYIVKLQGQDNLSSTIKNVKDELKSTGESATQLDKIQKQFEKISTSSAPLKKQMRDLQALMAQMNMNGLSGTEQFTQIAQYAGQVRDAISDAQTAISKYSSDTATLDAVTTAFQGISGGISMATGAMNLFGVENENVEQAILKVQSAMAILNGVQAIANTLNKDSALMLKLKAIGFGTSTAAQTANTASTVANTAAEGVNTASTVANTAAETANVTATSAATAGKVAQSAAMTSNAAATASSTAAQLANNAAVLANPYVLAAAAITALVAGIVIWISNMDDATDSQIALSAAVDAFNETADSEMKKCADSIVLFNKLKNTYDNAGDKVDDFANKLIKNKEVQKRLGVTLKTVDDVHRIFAQNTEIYQKASIARAAVLAAEQAQVALLAEALADLSEVYNKVKSGQEVNWRDMRKIIEKAGFSEEQASKLMREAGFKYQTEGIAYGNIKKGSGDLSHIVEAFLNSGGSQQLRKIGEQWAKEFEDEMKGAKDVNLSDLYNNNLDGMSDDVETVTKVATKSGKAVSKSTKQVNKDLDKTNDNLKTVLSTMEGCDAAIQAEEKHMKALDKNSETYAQDVESIKKGILAARVAKLSLIDQNTLSGLSEARNIIQDIIKDSPKNSKQLEIWQKELGKNYEKTYEMIKSMATSNSMSDLKQVQSAIDVIINNLPENSPELEKYIKLWIEITDKINAANQRIDDLKKGIEEGSVKKMQDEIKKLQDQLNNKKLDLNTRIKIQNNIDQLQREVDRTTKGKLSIEIPIQPSFITTGSKEDLRQSYANASTMIQEIQDDFAKGLIKTREEAIAKVAEINEQLEKIGLKPISVHIETNFEQWVNSFKDSLGGLNSVTSAVDSISSLTKSIDDGASAWEIFKNSISAVESVLDTFGTVMTAVNAIQEMFNLTKTKSAAISVTEASSTAVAAIAQKGKSIVDEKSALDLGTLTVALKAQEAAYLDLAAAAIFAAHAYIPFVGVEVANGFISTMMAAMTAQHAATKAMMAFEDGGIVGGSSYYGDKVIARLNSGEMVLNRRQQTTLFNAIDNGMFENGTNGNTTISFKLRGSDIYGSLKNFTNIKSKSSSIKGF